MSTLAGVSILMTTDTVGGVWIYATALATTLAARGADIHLVTLGPAPRADQRAMLQGTSVQLVETGLALEWQDPDARDLDHARRVLLALEREIQPDLVHLNSYREATFDWRAPVVVAAHSCVHSWGLACNETGFLQESRWQRYRALVAEGLQRADAWVAPSCAFGEVIGRIYEPPRPGALIWNGTASARQASASKDTFVLAAGRMWDKAKNLRVLAECADGLPCPVRVAGAGTDTIDAPSSLQQLGELAHGELRDRMSRAAIFASPALYEPFGLSVLEAASAGCALVLADIPTFRELWQDAALFVVPSDVRALRSTLSWLATDHRARATLQDAARQRSARYTLNRMATSYGELYGNLLAQAAPDHRSNTLAEACA
ncbi:putative UDP-Glycosyltransferase/glycogen phosphorylase protein [Bradyrhizobium sp. ORS 285]|uniref:glycosyltransferase family 4 protein n=1 Tax=Bradyrhizobium sp. ORS 285 TaxID=115808 RepID=UPI0002405BBD|nr:glycosyltransferase family 4 protein [Bradyrhizobium sp. ORS 285]CCD85388.1 putative glycosyltransferase protein [Bradyrhizobium sp. ORS 285]SMX60023.1 putative UDP-Glycosyltransferase/glycogen phosphorylase protein [Bradyrhizobium sp. ORS 285]